MTSLGRRAWALLWSCLLCATGASSALAETKAESARLLPAVTPLYPCADCPRLHRPDPETEGRLAEWARQLDSTLTDAAQDLGLTLDVSETGTPAIDDESQLVELAATRWMFAPRLQATRRGVRVRIVALSPGSKVLLERVETVDESELEIIGVVMMRDLVQAASREPTREAREKAGGDAHAVVVEARSEGRAVLALNSAAFGAYIGFSLQRAGGSEDPRLTYPLIALGTGVGLGASMIVADEWNVGVGDAWYVSAGIWWPALSGLLVASSYDKSDEDRLIFGLAGAAGGLGLATASLTFGKMSEGGAILAHSGGAFGLMLGGATQLIVEGTTDSTPTRGMGLGAGLGVLAAGTMARVVPTPSASRILLMDLGAGLGGLTGAALASPFVFENPSATDNRIWLSAIATGIVAGGTAGFFFTRSRDSAAGPQWLPSAGPVAVDVAGDLTYGVSAAGSW